jgi:hypothetical protein
MEHEIDTPCSAFGRWWSLDGGDVRLRLTEELSQIDVIARSLQFTGEQSLPCATVTKRDVNDAKDVCRHLKALLLERDNILPTQAGHEVAQLKYHVLPWAIWSGWRFLSWAIAAVLRGQKRYRVPDIECVRFEFLDQRAAGTRLFGEDNGGQTELLNKARHAVAESTCCSPMDDEDVWATGRGATVWWRLVDFPRATSQRFWLVGERESIHELAKLPEPQFET